VFVYKWCILFSVPYHVDLILQVCRAAYELMQTRHGDASQRFKSLDDVYYFGGQRGHRLRMTEDHKADNSELTEKQLPGLRDQSEYPRRRTKVGLGRPGYQNDMKQTDIENINQKRLNQKNFGQQKFKQQTLGMNELHVNKDEEIEIHGNLWNGYSIGQHVKSKEIGYFPSYKATDIFQKVNMPTYPEVLES
jgi:hypothetical protein